MLLRFSGFADGQAVLHSLGKGDCPKPCARGAGLDAGLALEPSAGGAGGGAARREGKGEKEEKNKLRTARSKRGTAGEEPREHREKRHEEDGENGTEKCADAVPGDDCFSAVLWAQTTGIYEHPEWYKDA